jgi:hypothetical protein
MMATTSHRDSHDCLNAISVIACNFKSNRPNLNDTDAPMRAEASSRSYQDTTFIAARRASDPQPPQRAVPKPEMTCGRSRAVAPLPDTSWQLTGRAPHTLHRAVKIRQHEVQSWRQQRRRGGPDEKRPNG